MMALAYAYSHGQGVDVDHEKSFNYHQKAAVKGLDFSLSQSLWFLLSFIACLDHISIIHCFPYIGSLA